MHRHHARYPDQVELMELHRIAGLLEGEGSFMAGPPSSPGSPVLRMTMVDRDVVDRAGLLLGAKTIPLGSRRQHWKPTFSVTLKGAPAVAWMEALRPLMGRRRQGQIDAALDAYVPAPHRLTRASVWQMLDLLAAGQSVAEVAKQVGVSQWCVYDLSLGRTHVDWAEQWHARRPRLRRPSQVRAPAAP